MLSTIHLTVNCAYCERVFDSFEKYKCHLKILHNKQTYGFGNKLLCGQDGCPREFNSFQALQMHCMKHYQFKSIELEQAGRLDIITDCSASPNCTSSNDRNDNMCSSAVVQLSGSILDGINANGIFEDAAIFIARLRSHPTISLSISVKIISMCGDLVKFVVESLLTETKTVFQNHNVNSPEAVSLLEAMKLLCSPFNGLEVPQM